MINYYISEYINYNNMINELFNFHFKLQTDNYTVNKNRLKK